jgi:1,5-anhydro-D-fructose reductase (1,5-anhydro-D-mannitol-forming)
MSAYSANPLERENMMQRVRYGIIGFGRFAEKAIAPAIAASPNSELVAIQKRSRVAAEEKSRELGIPFAFDSVGALVEHEGIDAVFIVSANAAHCPETIAAARAGKHVLVEKPMAMNVAEGERMIASCQAASVKLMVGHMLRFSPLLRRLRELVRSAALGEILFARAEFVYDARLSHRAWLYDRKVAGGGPVFDIGVHCLDTLRFVLDDEIVETDSKLAPEPTDTRTESTAALQLRFSKGTVGSIFCSYAVPLRRTFIEIVGTEGVVSASNFTVGERVTPLTVLRGENDQSTEERIEQITVPNLYVEEISHFSECILNNGEPLLSGDNGLRNQVVLDAAMQRRRK